MNERATTVEGVRRANLSAVLRLVHHAGPRSRATITAETGLNRSTVSDLVARLVSAGLVDERVPDPTRRVGRPSPIVAPSPDVVAIGINPEVDAIEIGAVSLGGHVRVRARIEAEMPSVAETVAVAADVVDGWREDVLSSCRILGTGVAVPGLVRVADGLVRLAPHLEWRDADIATPLADQVSLPVIVGNDASLGARAERLFGAARDHEDVVYLNGGASGIGGGLILHGRLIGGVGGYAGEWGQTAVDLGCRQEGRPRRVLEDEVNRSRLVESAGLVAPDDMELRDALKSVSGVGVMAEIVRQRAVLTGALSNAVNVLNPSMIVLGGFLGILRDVDAPAFDDDVRTKALAAPAERLELSTAALGEDRLIIGAADAAFEALLNDPLGCG